jgi:hypothetical protein
MAHDDVEAAVLASVPEADVRPDARNLNPERRLLPDRPVERIRGDGEDRKGLPVPTASSSKSMMTYTDSVLERSGGSYGNC